MNILQRLLRWLRASGERGAGALEYAGITLVASALMASAVTAVALTRPDVLGPQVSYRICTAFEKLPGGSLGCTPPEDVVAGTGPGGTPVEEDVPYEDHPWTYDEITSGPMVFIGDSYGSGEGAGDYDEDTDQDPSWWDELWGDPEHNMCHRSDNAWGVGIGDEHWPDNYSFEACSGATTEQVEGDNPGNDGEGPQIENVDEDTAMIFVSMGGNDAGFSDVLKECIATVFANNLAAGSGGGMPMPGSRMTCGDYYDGDDPDHPGQTRREAILAHVEEQIRQMYQDLREEMEDGAHIVHMGYPQLLDPDYVGLFEPDDVAYLNEMSNDLNAVMARIAREEGVHFIDPTEAFEGHGVGSDDPWILGLGFGDERSLPPESFHPTAEGQAAMQALVQEYLDSLP
ncbi:SGNH/GDSL hydrolase family protein [Serinicoccus kebangsaanensis]|uniref:SGNH/GDSL hydrolase family protein n=1 Tax=Serinicoccus kebangsaanensis TaxID=2602069 RepID=UPI00124D6E0A|nr:SGNH/GDSL hydrolase family protein [Serinicoccus kebangsaanensis]